MSVVSPLGPDEPREPVTKGGRRLQSRSKHTRETILSAAVTVLVEQGYANASTLRIQEEAGVSRGRLLHHFPSRERLLSAAVHHLAVERVRALRIDGEIPDSPVERIRAAIDAMWSNFTQPHFWASNELWNAARTSAELRSEITPVEHRMGQLIREQTDTLFGERFVAHPRYRSLREMLLTSMRGTAVTYTFDQRDPATDRHLEQWYSLAEEILVS